MKATTVGTSLTPGGRVSHRGFIDVIDCLEGVRGWALNLAALDEPPVLELRVGDELVATVTPDMPRMDIADALGTDVQAGFLFDPACLALVGDIAKSGDDVISVRIAGTALALGIGEEPPRAQEVITRLRQLTALSRPRSKTADLEMLLDDLRIEAVDLAGQPLRPLPENHQGFIETLAIDASGQVWMIGWMKRGHLTEFAAVISERQKIPASVAVMTFRREDLAADACGVIGLLSSSWRPTSPNSEFHLFFGNGGRFHLLAHVPVRLITATELATEYEGIRESVLGEGRAIALQRLLTALDTWMPARAAGQAFGTETSVDRILLVPGLGCLVEGWLISPLKRIEGLRLRVGGAIMTALPQTIYWKPRLDLLEAFPGSELLVRRAGFVALFTGDSDPDDFHDPMVKIVFDGGQSANWPVSTKIFRRLGHSATVEDALLFYPALEEEGFFADFARAAIDASLSGMNPPVPVRVSKCKSVLVLVLPEDRCDLYLLFAELAHYLRAGLGCESVALVASSTANRADATWMFQEAQRDAGIPLSLVVIDEASQALAQLPEILTEIGAARFVFVGPGVFLTKFGWEQVRQIMARDATDLTFLALEADDFDRQEGGHGVTARCFAWDTVHFMRWSMQAPSFLGGFHRENGLLRTAGPHVIHQGAARNSRWTIPTRIQDAVNAAVYDAAPDMKMPGPRMPQLTAPERKTPDLEAPGLQMPGPRAPALKVAS